MPKDGKNSEVSEERCLVTFESETLESKNLVVKRTRLPRDPPRIINDAERKRILAKTGSICYLCKAQLELRMALPWKIEHVITFSQDMERDVKGNTLPACHSCNIKKSPSEVDTKTLHALNRKHELLEMLKQPDVEKLSQRAEDFVYSEAQWAVETKLEDIDVEWAAQRKPDPIRIFQRDTKALQRDLIPGYHATVEEVKVIGLEEPVAKKTYLRRSMLAPAGSRELAAYLQFGQSPGFASFLGLIVEDSSVGIVTRLYGKSLDHKESQIEFWKTPGRSLILIYVVWVQYETHGAHGQQHTFIHWEGEFQARCIDFAFLLFLQDIYVTLICCVCCLDMSSACLIRSQVCTKKISSMGISNPQI